MPHYLLPSLHTAVRTGQPHDLLVLALAGWFRYLLGRNDAGRPIDVEDPLADRLTSLVHGTDPRPLLGERAIFGDLVDRADLVARLGDDLQRMERHGVRATVAARLAQHRPAAALPSSAPGTSCPRPA
jgi:fructuronate reductase/mannitol 2-dehydrogenase